MMKSLRNAWNFLLKPLEACMAVSNFHAAGGGKWDNAIKNLFKPILSAAKMLGKLVGKFVLVTESIGLVMDTWDLFKAGFSDGDWLEAFTEFGVKQIQRVIDILTVGLIKPP